LFSPIAPAQADRLPEVNSLRTMRAMRLHLGNRKGAAAAGGAVLLILAAAWAAVVGPSTGVISGMGVLALVGLRAGAGILALSASRRLAGTPPSRAWRFLAIAWILSSLSAAILWAGMVVRGRSLNVPSLADLILAATSCALWAIASYGAVPRERFGRLRSWLDVSIIFLSVLGLAWMILLQPVLEIGIASPVPAFWGLLWPALDLVALALLLRLLLMGLPGAGVGRSACSSLAGGGARWRYRRRSLRDYRRGGTGLAAGRAMDDGRIAGRPSGGSSGPRR
jgi:hypothetical protein